MKHLSLWILLVSLSSFAAGDIKDCEEASDREKCYATTIDSKLEVILRRLGHGHGHGGGEPVQQVVFYWGKDCTKDVMGSGFVPTRLTSLNLETTKAACNTIAAEVKRFSSDGYVDSYKVGSRCVNPDPRPNKTDEKAVSRLCLEGIAG